MKLQKNQNLAFQLYLVGMPIIFLLSLFFYVFFDDNIYALMTGFLFIFTITVVYAIRYFGIMSLYSIFLYTSTFFLYNCFWFSLFDKSKDFLMQTFPIRHFIDISVGVKFIFCCILLTYVMHITYCLINKKRLKDLQIVKHQLNYEKVGIGIMLIFLLPSIVKLYIQLIYVQKYGYLTVFTGDLSLIKYPIWTAGANLLFITGYSLFVASNPSKNKFIIYSVLVFFIMIFSGMKGQRGIVLGPLVGLLYWYFKKYSKKIRIRTLISLFVFIISFTYLLGTIRNLYGHNSDVSSSDVRVLDLVSDVLYSQTTSRCVPMKIIEGDLPYHNYPFIFSPFFSYLNYFLYPSKGQTVVSVEKYNDISQVVMYSISPSAHFAGKGYGGAFIAEAYDCGGFFGIIFWGIILAIFIAFCDFTNLNIRNKYIPFLFLVILNFAMLPRNRLFTIFDAHFVKLFVLCMLIPLINTKQIWRYEINGK
ncbi:O-antigen polysaccharide polymerase Wzy [Treponema brennaborense]|uniref:O-antigen polysaccharide polymerase Wzy n=1 Tax=Treponema brennaborense (strain DSM 12168 / CIP 105900 / DD5/3) TaxID=906968 RepID=F4LPR8_TREBD|nr:O-antigen polysaccharide polymerase Wzy [Treponema brennaborense]AEE17064.1 hypothetical protein Trebr_1641 [Treponema brennaborense DSM 12168]